MPMPQKRRRRPSRSSPDTSGSSHRRIGEESVVESGGADPGTYPVADGGASLRGYQLLLATRLAWLELPPSADGDDPASFDCPDLPSGEIVQALTRCSFRDEEMLDALVEYEVHKCSSDEIQGQDSGRASGESDSADVDVLPVEPHDPISEDFLKSCYKLGPRKAPGKKELTKREQDELHQRHAYFRIRALLLLKGNAIDKLDDAALKRKYPPNLVAEHFYFLHYERDDAFGWYFDPELCKLASLTDYQRLVLFDQFGENYYSWSRYRLLFNTPETDRKYLEYWKALIEKMKWTEAYIPGGKISDEWRNVRMKARYHAYKIATEFGIQTELASIGFEDFMWRTQHHVVFWKDLDVVFFEIWKLVTRDQVSFKKALEKVYNQRKFPTQQRYMEEELGGNSRLEDEFCRCTFGITIEVPDYRARELIAQQVKNKLKMSYGYEHYAEKKLKVAEYIGLETTT